MVLSDSLSTGNVCLIIPLKDNWCLNVHLKQRSMSTQTFTNSCCSLLHHFLSSTDIVHRPMHEGHMKSIVCCGRFHRWHRVMVCVCREWHQNHFLGAVCLWWWSKMKSVILISYGFWKPTRAIWNFFFFEIQKKKIWAFTLSKKTSLSNLYPFAFWSVGYPSTRAYRRRRQRRWRRRWRR